MYFPANVHPRDMFSIQRPGNVVFIVFLLQIQSAERTIGSESDMFVKITAEVITSTGYHLGTFTEKVKRTMPVMMRVKRSVLRHLLSNLFLPDLIYWSPHKAVKN